MLVLLQFLLIIFCLFGVSCLFAMPMVDARVMFAKGLVIGEEKPEIVEKMKQIAERSYNNEICVVDLDATYTMEVKSDSIKRTIVENEKVKVSFSEEGFEIVRKSYTLRSAVFKVGCEIFPYALILCILWIILLLKFFHNF